ncbi:helix-turn-helix domain-containing protein [Flavobacterium ustbae]|uniref:helix-turn-helix domain-containing protein n=1 Tax=Flavobacterium ustbae TaxID=2488790 RepID=UPI000F7A4880|nr:helix-turn-helix domain-containing protein [Flavobacterium ustbae]
MHKKITILLIILLSSRLTYSQNSFEKIYLETYQVLLSSNPKKALSNTDYLYRIAKNNPDRIKTRMLKAQILYQYGIHTEAINVLKQADSLAIIDKDYVAQAKACGFLASLYRENEIYNLGKIYLNKAVAVSKKIKNKTEMYRFQGNLSQELAYYDIFDSNFSKAISNLKKGIQFFEKASTKSDKNYQIAINDELIGRNYLSLQKIDSALFHYERGLKEIDASLLRDSPLRGFLYNGLANVYASINDSKNAVLNYKKAEEIADLSDYFALKQEVYNSLMEFYKKRDTKKYVFYNEKNLKLSEAEKQSRKAMADNLFKSLEKNQQHSESEYQQNKYVILGVSVLLILITIGFYIYKRKQDHKKIRAFIANNKPIHMPETTLAPKRDTAKEYMSEATEKSILKSINEFEASQFYLNKTLSINSTAAELNINHRYLSYVINKHKSKDFASYINELRINYIVDRLKNDSDYLKYKISYLAEQAGFSSHSRFTITFKKITGVSPLTFITYLQKNNKEAV